MNAIFQRTSIRSFKEQQVEVEKVEKMLRAAMAAPSAGDQRPWEFYVVTDKEKLAELSACSPSAGCTKNAPMAFVVCSKKEAYFPENVEMDLSAAVENILLEAVELELGAVWLGIAPVEERMEAVEKVLNMTDSIRPFAIIPVGYPVKVNSQEDRYDESRIHYV